MNPPDHIDMGPIRAALAERMAGGLGGGSGAPVASQVAPGGPIPTAPQQAQTGPLPLPASQTQPQGQGQPQQPQQGQGAKPDPQFDDGTKAISKALIARLLKVI